MLSVFGPFKGVNRGVKGVKGVEGYVSSQIPPENLSKTIRKTNLENINTNLPEAFPEYPEIAQVRACGPVL